MIAVQAASLNFLSKSIPSAEFCFIAKKIGREEAGFAKAERHAMRPHETVRLRSRHPKEQPLVVFNYRLEWSRIC